MEEFPPHEPERLKNQDPEELLKSLNLGFRRKKKKAGPNDKERVAAQKQALREQKDQEQKNKEKEQYKNFPKWLLKMKPFQILLMPYSEVPYSHDFYEMAMIVMHKRKWGMFRIFWTHFLIINPVLWPPYFSYVKKLSFMRFIWRWMIFLAIPSAATYGLYWFLYFFKYTDVHEPLTVIMITAYVAMHMIGGYEEFRNWRQAYASLSKKLKA